MQRESSLYLPPCLPRAAVTKESSRLRRGSPRLGCGFSEETNLPPEGKPDRIPSQSRLIRAAPVCWRLRKDHMIAHLRGRLIHKQPGQAIVEAGGVGYDVTISVPTFTALPSVVRRPRCISTPRCAKIKSPSSAFLSGTRSGSSSGSLPLLASVPSWRLPCSAAFRRSAQSRDSRAGSRFADTDTRRGQETRRAPCARTERQAG